MTKINAQVKEETATTFNLQAYNSQEKAQLSYNLGKAAYQEGYYEKAESHLLNGLELYKEIKDTLGMANSYLVLGKNYYEIQFAKHRSLAYFEKAENCTNHCSTLAKSINHIPLLGESRLLSARLIERKDGYVKGGKAFEECLAFYEKHQLETKELLYHVADNLFWQGKAREAITLCKEKLASKKVDLTYLKVINLQARCYSDLGILDSASIYYQKAMETIKQIPPTIQIYPIYYDYVKFLLVTENFEKGKIYFHKVVEGLTHYLGSESIIKFAYWTGYSLRIGDVDNNLAYNEKIQDILNSYKDVMLTDKMQFDLTYAFSLYDVNKLEESIILYQEQLKYAKERNNKWLECDLYYSLSENEYGLGNYEKAIEYGQKGIELCQSINYTMGIEDYYHLLDSASIMLNDYEAAYRYKSLQNKIQDSLILPFKQREEISGYETKLEETLNKTEKLQLQNKEKEALAQTQQKRIYGLITILVIISLLAYFYNEWTKKQTQIKVRQQITKDIHDTVGGVLNDLNRTAKEAMIKPINNGQQVPLEKVVQLSNQANTTLRKVISPSKDKGQPVSLAVMEVILRDLTIKKMLHNQQPYELNIQGFQKKNLLPPITHHHFSMIYKEALHNAVKYGTKDPIYINIAYDEKNLSLTVINSIATDSLKIEEELTSTQMGLENIRERAKLLKGQVEFEQADDFFAVQFSCPTIG